MGKRVVKNYPSPRLMETIGATNQSTAEAIGELVANSFDARFKADKLEITIDIRDGEIKVIDNGKGMTVDVLEKAVCIAEDMSRHIERGEGTKGLFGMGFKTSCSTLGDFYQIYTRPADGKLEYYTEFDIKDYSSRPSGSDAWDVVIEDRKPSKLSPLGSLSHGTAFVVKNLHSRNPMPGAILKYLGEAFKGHIEKGDVITVIDSTGEHVAIPKKYNFIEGSKVNIDESFGPKNKYHVTGWVALDSQTHNDGNYGFNIYRHDQLVKTFDKSWFRAHLMTSRIIGEVNMNFLDATFYKQGIQQSDDWEYVTSHMKEFLKDVVKASQNLSKQHNVDKPAERKKIIKTLHADYDIPDNEDISESQPTNEKPVAEKQSINNTIKFVVDEKSLTLEDNEEITISLIEKDNAGEANAPFDYIFSGYIDDDKSELQVIIFKNHPLWEKKIDDEVKRIIATSDAIYRMLVEQLNYETPKALKIRNEWLNMRVRKG